MTAIGEIIAGFAGKVFNVFKAGAAFIVGRVLAAFGLSIVTLEALLPNLKDMLSSYALQIPEKGQQFISAVGIDIFMAMVLSALTVRIATKVFILPTSVANNLPGAGP